MGVTEDLADELARDVIKAVEATGDEMIISDVQKILGSTSQTAEEAFLTAVRVRRANIKARAYLLDRLKRLKAAKEAAADVKTDSGDA